jgi:2-polyprenyl-3-methyl-5-hydroxy-6-metoxy-1,4-benzoquinol methylase
VDAKLPKILGRFEGHLPVSSRLRYLDMGCGSGELTLGLARAGMTNIVGVDFLPRFIASARAHARAAGMQDRVRFVSADLRTWTPPHRFDVVLSFDAFEHIGNPRAFMQRMQDFLAPGGIAVISFGPLFHSPFGDHMSEFFRVPIPWRGALFSDEAILRLRREFYRPTDPARRLNEIAGGLNQMKYSDFLRDAEAAGWRFRYLRTNAFLRNPLLRKVADITSSTPVLRDYVVHNVYAVMEPRVAMPLRQAA